jgi:hypothetical protein
MFKSIVCTYPDFRALPKGLKQLLLASENQFFGEIKTPGSQSLEKKHFLPSLQKRLFSRRLETTHAQSRAFQWSFWSK